MKKPPEKKPIAPGDSRKDVDFVDRSSERSVPVKASEKRAALSKKAFPIVGVGASAGGLEAFTQFLKHLPADTGMGFVLVQHLDPVHESALTEILSRATAMPVDEVTNNLRVEPNHVYVIPPNTRMEISEGVLKLSPRNRQALGAQHSIDAFFESLARDRSERAIGVVLSGTASDGTLGLEAIKAEGGITFAQDESAKFDSMPRSAINAGCVDFVLPPGAIAKEVARIAQHPLVAGAGGDSLLPPEAEREADQREGPEASLASGGHGTPNTGARRARAEAKAGRDDPQTVGENGFKKILLLLRNHCGVDFSLYKSNTIQRRVARRMVLNRQNAPRDYAAFLRGNAKELDALYSDVLISVTSFFRNAEAFEALKRKVFPALTTQRGRDEPMRVWTLGCSTGQEAYSIAMSFAEFSEKLPRAPKLQIFATDLNEALLEKARHGLYAKTLAQDLSPERLRRFFIEEEGGYRISKALREQVVFARQNVMSDPPFSRMDLISCRNLLIYFDAGLQKKIMPAFHYALKPGGFLFLGASESVGQFTELFEPADKKQKIFSRKAASTPSFRLPLPHERSARPSSGKRPLNPVERAQGLPEGIRGEFNAQREADRLSVSQFAPPGVLIDAALQVLQFRGATGAYLEPPIGKASFDLLKMAREDLMLPLRAAINQAKREKKTVRRENVRVRQHGTTRAVNLHVIPLKNLQERCYLILFEEAKAGRGARDATLSEARAKPGKPGALGITRPTAESRRIAELERELSETRDYLQSIQEQFDSSTEELQASSEEVQSSNEELQSINEEMETSKEELESTNEELTTVNEEMTNRNAELNRLNNDLSNLHVSIGTAILVLERDLTLRRFTVQAEKIFNLLATDVGRPLSGVRHNLDCRDLEEFVREVIDTVSVRQREVRDKEGRWYSLRARPYLTNDNKIDGAVLVLVDIDALKGSEQAIKRARDYAEAVLRTTPNPLLVLRTDLRVDAANEAFYQAFKVAPADTEGRLIYEIGNRQWNIPQLRELLEDILPQKSVFNGYEVAHEFETLGHRTMLLNARRMDNEEGVPERILLAIEDITLRKQAETALRVSEERLRLALTSAGMGSWRGNLRTGLGTRDANLNRLLGLAPAESTQKIYDRFKLVHPEDRAAAVAALQRATEEKESYEVEYRVILADGALRWLSEKGRFIAGEKGSPDFISGVTLDITGRKAAEATLHAAIEGLKTAHRNAESASRAKDDFLAALSHELRTPLTPVLMAAATLREDERLPADAREQLEMIERNVALEARLIDDLLDLTAVSRGKLPLRAELCDTHSLIDLAIEIVREDAREKEISIERVFAAHHSGLVADPTRFQQVIWNLLRNAVKFTPRGGIISIRTREEKTPEGVRWLRIEVVDSGIGIDPALLEQIFLPFDQGGLVGDHRFGGVGLGLAIARAVVDLHGGRISARSEGPNRGSTFVVELPGAVEPQSGLTASRSPLPPGLSATVPTLPKIPIPALRLLVVEDHSSTLQTLATLLKRDGHQVVAAPTFTEALAAAAAHPFDLVISDLGLPDGSGTDLMKKLRANYGLRGIAMSGYGTAEDFACSRDAGFATHLVKPVAIAELRRVIAALPPVEN